MPSYLANRRIARSVLDPRSIGGLVKWYDASELTTITKDGSDFVSVWGDLSPWGANATQATAANQPKYLADGINGRPAIVGDGVDDSMAINGLPIGLNHNFYIVAAYDTTINLMPQYTGFLKGSNVSTRVVRMADTSANPAVGLQVPFLADINLHPANSPYNIKSGIPAVYSFLRNADIFRAKWTYGDTITLGPAGGLHATQSTTTKDIFTGWGGSASFRIAELVCFNRNLTRVEEVGLSRYFEKKYGVGI